MLKLHKGILKWKQVLRSLTHQSKYEGHFYPPDVGLLILCPLSCSPNAVLRLRFSHFATECSWDHMYVYDGDSIYSPLIAVFRWAPAFLIRTPAGGDVWKWIRRASARRHTTTTKCALVLNDGFSTKSQEQLRFAHFYCCFGSFSYWHWGWHGQRFIINTIAEQFKHSLFNWGLSCAQRTWRNSFCFLLVENTKPGLLPTVHNLSSSIMCVYMLASTGEGRRVPAAAARNLWLRLMMHLLQFIYRKRRAGRMGTRKQMK